MKLLIGFIMYNKTTAKYLSYFLPSLFKQTFVGFEEFVVDNSDEEVNQNSEYIKQHYPKMKMEWAGGNLGFARANNIIIRHAVELEAEYLMLINPDTIMAENAVEQMILALDSNERLGSVSAKILKWDFANNLKTDIIDSCGMKMKRGLNFFDIGQNHKDFGQFDNSELLGPSGTAPMYRVSALEKIKFSSKPLRGHKGLLEANAQYFDELMFMYKEDCDLNYRLKLAGYESRLVNIAKIYHDRSVSGTGESDIKVALNRRNKDRQAKKWAFLHQQIIFTKFWHIQSLSNKFWIMIYQKKMFLFILLFEWYLLAEYINLFKIIKDIKKYRK